MHDIVEITFTTGFEYKNRLFGFYKKKLYRLPYQNKFRYYPLKEVIFKEDHYRICRDKVGINKINFLLQPINFKTSITIINDLPF